MCGGGGSGELAVRDVDALPGLVGCLGGAVTALDRAGLRTLTDDDHQAVRDLTRHLEPATLRQVTDWLERTRTAALALRGEPVPPVRPVVRRSRL